MHVSWRRTCRYIKRKETSVSKHGVEHVASFEQKREETDTFFEGTRFERQEKDSGDKLTPAEERAAAT